MTLPPAIKTLPTSERPRERCLEKGPSSLSLRECLALLIHTGPPGLGCLGVASELLTLPGNGMSESDQERAFFTAMESSARGHLQTIRGLGPTAQARLLAAFELARRYSTHRLHELRHVPRGTHLPAQAVARVPLPLRQATQEWLGFVPCFRNRGLGELCLVEKGVRTHVNVDPAELFARLLALRPSSFFLFHNHPGGSLEPSAPDIELTLRVQEVAQLLGIKLLGHGLIAPTGESWVPMLRRT